MQFSGIQESALEAKNAAKGLVGCHCEAVTSEASRAQLFVELRGRLQGGARNGRIGANDGVPVVPLALTALGGPASRCLGVVVVARTLIIIRQKDHVEGPAPARCASSSHTKAQPPSAQSACPGIAQGTLCNEFGGKWRAARPGASQRRLRECAQGEQPLWKECGEGGPRILCRSGRVCLMTTEDSGADGDEKSERAAELLSSVACCRHPDISCVLALQTRGTHLCQWPRGVLLYRSGYWTRACSTCAHVRVRPLPPEGEQPGLQQPLRPRGESAPGNLRNSLCERRPAPRRRGRTALPWAAAGRPVWRSATFSQGLLRAVARSSAASLGCCVSKVKTQLLHGLILLCIQNFPPLYARVRRRNGKSNMQNFEMIQS
jgi:hypothetical protein